MNQDTDTIISEIYKQLYPNKELIEQYEDLQDQMELYHCSFLDGLDARTSLQKTIDSKNKSIEDLQDTSQTLATKLNEVVAKAEDYKKQAEHLAKKGIQLANQLETMTNERMKFQGLAVTNESNYEKMKKDKENLASEVSNLYKQINALECSGRKSGDIATVCGKCLACEYTKSKASLVFLTEAATQSDSENKSLQKQLKETQDAYTKNADLLRILAGDLFHVKSLYRICITALNEIVEYKNFYRRKEIAMTALTKANDYIDDNQIKCVDRFNYEK